LSKTCPTVFSHIEWLSQCQLWIISEHVGLHLTARSGRMIHRFTVTLKGYARHRESPMSEGMGMSSYKSPKENYRPKARMTSLASRPSGFVRPQNSDAMYGPPRKIVGSSERPVSDVRFSARSSHSHLQHQCLISAKSGLLRPRLHWWSKVMRFRWQIPRSAKCQ
jgi:hypothetical protein